MLLGWMVWTAVASAGSGPWTLNPREHNVYVGVDHFRYDSLRGGEGAPVPITTDVVASSVTGVWTMGLATDLDFELTLPFESVRVSDPETALCVEGKPDDWCDPTANLGEVSGTLKWRIVDELYRSPVSVSVSGGFRSGEAYASHRNRLTTLGDGTTDLGLGASVGRTASVGRGWYTLSADAWYYLRLPHEGAVFGDKVPSDEVVFSAEGLFALHPRLAVGPAVFGFTRTGGADFSELDFDDLNAFASLNGAQVKVGAKAAVFGTDGGPSVIFTVARTVYARNNPSDTLSLSLGLGFFVPRKVRLLDAASP